MRVSVLLLAALLVAAAARLAQAGSAGATSSKNLAAFQSKVMRRSLRQEGRKFDLGDKPEDDDDSCGEWKVGTATGYSTDGTDQGDKPMAPNDLGEWRVPGKFFRDHEVVAIDGSDWGDDRYHYIDVALEGKVGRLESWDLCQDKDCSKDNPKCCSTNMEKYTDDDGSGYLLDVETHACKDLWGLEDCQNWLVAPVWYRVCGSFDQKDSVEKYDMECEGLEGDRKCEGYEDGRTPTSDWADSTGDTSSDGGDGGDGGDGEGTTDSTASDEGDSGDN